MVISLILLFIGIVLSTTPGFQLGVSHLGASMAWALMAIGGAGAVLSARREGLQPRLARTNKSSTAYRDPPKDIEKILPFDWNNES